jgi:hypothetical protein
MASVLCKGIGELIDGFCQCVGIILCLPCRLCTVLSELFKKSPFAVQVAVAVLLQGPAMVIALLGILDSSTTCSGSNSNSSSQALPWLVSAIVFGIIHIVAAVYLAVRVVSRDDPELERMNTDRERANHLLCQDHWMALYILFGLIGFVIFLGVGSNWLWSGAFDIDDSDHDCTYDAHDSLQDNIQLVLGLGWIFLVVGAMSLCCTTSRCCTCCTCTK